MRTPKMEQLIAKLARAADRSGCSPRECVESLLLVAASAATKLNTHTDCHEFHDQAHDMFHAAQDAFAPPQPTEPTRAN